MKLKDALKADKAQLQDKEAIIQLQNRIIKDYKKYLELSNQLSDKLFTMSDSFKDEVYNYFENNDCVRSSKDHNGNIFMSPITTYYKMLDSDNTVDTPDISVTFGKNNDYEKTIQIIRHSSGKSNLLTYTFEDSFEKIMTVKVTPILNNDWILINNFESKISECDSTEELRKFQNKLKENIEDLQSKLSTDIALVGVYKIEDDRQFNTFEKAFETALEESK